MAGNGLTLNNLGYSQSGNSNASNMFSGGYGSRMTNKPTGSGSTGYGALNTLGFGGLTSGNLGNNFGGSNFGDAFFEGKRNNDKETYCIRLRGLPYSSNEEDIMQVFDLF